MAVLASASVSTQSRGSDYHIDYTPIMTRGFGILGEPSMLDRCNAGHAGIRIFEHATGRPLAIVRVEKTEDGAQITNRAFENGRASETAQTEISEAAWADLTGLIDKSGFWTHKMDESVGMADSPTMWIEACLTGQFRSISIYPDREDVADDVVAFLSDRTR